MKRFILGGLSILVLSAAVVPFATRTETVEAAEANVSPVTLVFLAERGMLDDIDGSSDLLVGYRSGRISEETLVRSAIDKGMLAPETISDRQYLRTVRNQLRHLGTDENSG
ncbi:hypothetical protein [Synechococcus sp. PCC 7336]|uniref:hypothetical protein n=1 Tax=Synechococcus sp. PCC 7336 TaxID=195250 RepID=UPI00034CD39D|nr:hypothetical protein [Synechococcus sp. PCC 7336]